MEMETATFVIVGGGIAGVSCAEVLLFLCPSAKIILITQSSLIKAVKNLIPLAKSLTKFDVEECSIDTLKDKIKVVIDTAEYIDSSKRVITTKLGNTYEYNYLCLCTGADPKLIEKDNEYVIGIRDTESVLEFQKRIKNSKKIVLVGNGGIASEVAFEAKNIIIDWVIKDEYISSTFVDPGAAEFFQNKLKNKNKTSEETVAKRMRYSEENLMFSKKKGAALGPDWHRKIDIAGTLEDLPESVKIHYKVEVVKIEKTKNCENPFPLKVTLSNNEVIYADFVVSATGVNPSISFKCDKEFKLGPDGGICVDELQRTNLNFIYAAGDICCASWDLSDDWFQMRLWTQARQMGAMAGKAMAAAFQGETATQDFCFELFGHVTKLYGYQVVLLGRYNGQGLDKNYEILLRVTPDKEYIKFVLHNGKLKGALLIGETGLEETCENLILNKLDLTPYKEDLLDPNIDIEDYFD
ncbi:pyridine nucleotide-disulfide oxidoreductase domain-containing protein 1 [Condylostylus longicornis]|uniref:pyridine nucleotide-disulfide oxidoreductase domain-containing protein 1 n=1 Tax=Condylostylus longicornis TaxID=2530218 RepID=UPI00244DE858|nr:pyridine nucleotide-disulfide oxidoreductase domain-containing protein 1 [Condylostylus longicornis]XP_055386058.1 pyridine nucleotide-disulfide oxidoreductase domain-containing protein 1 [Condylostylus longicornis]